MADQVRKNMQMTQQRYNAQMTSVSSQLSNRQVLPAMRHAPNQTLPMGCWELGSQSAEAVPSRELVAPSEDEGGIEAYKLGDLVDARFLLVGDLVSLIH